nr:PREDICTED: protein yippee-like 2 [Anolis carolinensis]|eukprot:XP_016854294.1 PREDICTED: protein yippee-like 2 [Anolis carolinensis]
MVKMTRSKTFQAYLPSCHRTYSCIHCRAHLANHDELISKVGWDGVHSVGYTTIQNPRVFVKAEKVFCCARSKKRSALWFCCLAKKLFECLQRLSSVLSSFLFCLPLVTPSVLLQFKEHAFESSQKYKEGKYIIELAHMIKDNGWD